MRYDKQEMLDEVIRLTEEDIKGKKEVVENAKEAVRKSPTAMQARYDTSRSENDNLRDYHEGDLRRAESGLGQLCSFRFDTPDMILTGSVVQLEDVETREQTAYFILPYGGGSKIETEQGVVHVITPQAPIARGIFGKRLGYSFRLEMDGVTPRSLKVIATE